MLAEMFVKATFENGRLEVLLPPGKTLIDRIDALGRAGHVSESVVRYQNQEMAKADVAFEVLSRYFARQIVDILDATDPYDREIREREMAGLEQFFGMGIADKAQPPPGTVATASGSAGMIGAVKAKLGFGTTTEEQTTAPQAPSIGGFPTGSALPFPSASKTDPGRTAAAPQGQRNYAWRDYGNRVGVWRMLDALAGAGARASFATNAAIAERYPELLSAVQQAGHEVIAHSTDMNGTIDSSLPEADERALIGDAVARLTAASGESPKGWLSIARSQSFHTLDILKANGLKYCCDWVNDELPYRMTNGLINLPLNHELSDRTIIAVQQQSADSWAQSLEDAFDWLAREAAESGGGRMLPVHVTPYIMGLPYRIGAFERLLARLAERPECWFARGDEIVATWEAQQ
jgi:peptidoglycan/xylan/chitin deacetylase (PgdA/CDA1 family)